MTLWFGRVKAAFWKEPVACIALLLTLLLGVLNSDRFWELFKGSVVADVYTFNDQFQRCGDFEIVVTNRTEEPSYKIRITYEVDYFARRESDQLVSKYYSLRDLLIAPGEPTVAPRGLESPVPIEVDNWTILIQKLGPGERLHIKFSESETQGSELLNARNELLRTGDRDLMNYPVIRTASHDGGKLEINRIIEHPCLRKNLP